MIRFDKNVGCDERKEWLRENHMLVVPEIVPEALQVGSFNAQIHLSKTLLTESQQE